MDPIRDKIGPVRNEERRLDLNYSTKLDAAIRLIRFDPEIPVDCRRQLIERELSGFEYFDYEWHREIQPVTKKSKKAALRLANAFVLHVEKAMKDPNLGPEFLQHGPELVNIRLRAEKAANEKIGSKRGRPQKEAAKRMRAVLTAWCLMYFYSSRANTDAKGRLSRLVKLANLIYSGKSEETQNFKTLCNKLGAYYLNRLGKEFGFE